MLTFKCESCKKKITTDDSLAGQQGECPFCKAVVTAPGTPPETGLEVQRCPKCGARRQEMKRTCGFCGADLEVTNEPPKTRRVEAAKAKTTRRAVVQQPSEGADRRKLMVLVGVLVVAAGVAGFMYLGGREEADPNSKWTPDDLCRINMMQLSDRLVEFTAHPETLPKATGSAFWVEIAKRANMPERLRCPVAKAHKPCDFRGPVKEWKDVAPTGILMADFADSHPDGVNVLMKHGEVLYAPKGSPLYDRALAETKE